MENDKANLTRKGRTCSHPRKTREDRLINAVMALARRSRNPSYGEDDQFDKGLESF
jgi:hypothetical protein